MVRSIQRISEMSGSIGGGKGGWDLGTHIFLHFGESLGSWQKTGRKRGKGGTGGSAMVYVRVSP